MDTPRLIAALKTNIAAYRKQIADGAPDAVALSRVVARYERDIAELERFAALANAHERLADESAFQRAYEQGYV